MARTVAVNAITIGQCFYLLNSRYLIDSSVSIKAHLENKYLPMGIGAVIVLFFFFVEAEKWLIRLKRNSAAGGTAARSPSA